ncbi:response regulator [Couchioplanes caeruleus]|uniref:Sensor-like histidine kinase SenX3 n=2 Tax=Couchioplanes caeruleus TaxID=56438 RepID=A0A1K0GWM7_9ACTN|nr:response regulator [Couchioplanes caeruleus]OJF13811.1 hybrid sensor histidine kinase/response regulator [Couchioplanes caeruleus subsp. caeruleus]ROP34338.1 response regulator receiver domain-containing protein [Couchioplanes caeruleus]
MTPTVLIVDDSLTVRMDLHEAFEADGFATRLCATGEEARAAFRDGGFEVAVLDVLLPDADGVELLQELRALPGREQTVTVLLSSEEEVADRLHGLRTGADEYVGKPYDSEYVVARSRQLLGEDGTPAEPRPTVLVIDDSLTFREQLRQLLEPEGYSVITAASGEEGLRTAADRRPQAVIVDGVMPGIDGATVIRRLRLDPTLRDTPCLLMTAADDYATEVQMLEAGADAFVRKQQDLAVVLAKLAAVLRTSAEQLPIEVIGSLHGPGKVLAVSADRRRLDEWGDTLRADGFDVVSATGGDEALDLLAAQPVDCVVLHLDREALETCARIKEAPQIGDTPLVMTGDQDDALLESLAAGADDYVRSDGADTLRAHVRAQIRRKQSLDESRRIREELMRRELDAAGERAARQLAETRAALVEELEWRNRELEAFSGSVSHDLRGPLQVISSYAETMLDEDDEDEPLGPEVRHRIERIQAAATRMADLVESLLILSRASRGELRRRRFDLTETVWQVIREVEAREPDREIEFRVDEAMSADADEGLVRVILENLINNACKFTRKVEKPAVEVGWNGPGEDPRYHVRDNGAGFPAGKASALFRPFARLHSAEDFPGTGIGLTTVHRAVERHGGEIHAEGEDGRGATFWFTLPPARRA